MMLLGNLLSLLRVCVWRDMLVFFFFIIPLSQPPLSTAVDHVVEITGSKEYRPLWILTLGGSIVLQGSWSIQAGFFIYGDLPLVEGTCVVPSFRAPPGWFPRLVSPSIQPPLFCLWLERKCPPSLFIPLVSHPMSICRCHALTPCLPARSCSGSLQNQGASHAPPDGLRHLRLCLAHDVGRLHRHRWHRRHQHGPQVPEVRSSDVLFRVMCSFAGLTDSNLLASF